jgi:hypothetical protein
VIHARSSRRNAPARSLVAALFVCGILPHVALAHDDDEHGAAPEIERLPSAGNVGDLYEVLVKYRPAPLGRPMDLKVFVADARTNEPIAGARVELTLTGAHEYKLEPKPEASPGLYDAQVTFDAAGDYDAVAKVSRGAAADLVTLGTFHAGLSDATRAPRKLHLAIAASAGAAAVLLALLLMGVLRRRKKDAHA